MIDKYSKLETYNNGFILTLKNKTKYFFNTKGYLTEIEDINGNKTQILFDDGKIHKVQNDCGYLEFEYINNLINKVTDNTGRYVEYNYTENRLTSVKDVEGYTNTYVYDEKGRLTQSVDPLNNVKVTNVYDDQNRNIDQTMGDGTKNLFNYDDENNVTILTERNGTEIIYKRDSENRIYETVYINGSEKSVFNEKDQTTSFTDRNGNTYLYEYDENGNITKEIDPLGNVTQYVYDLNNKITAITKPDGTIYSYTYDENGNMLSANDPLGRETKMEYNTRGLPEKIILPNGDFALVNYDEKGNPIVVKDPEGNTTIYEYDDLNRIISITKPEGNKIEYQYTPKGKIKKIIKPDGSCNTSSYDERGYLIQTIDESGNATKYKYNNIGKLIEKTDALNNITKYEYDSMSNLSKLTLSDGSIVKYNYNAENQLESFTDAESNTTKLEYDANDNVVKVIDPRGNTSNYNYDALNRLVEAVNANNAATKIEYRFDGKVRKVNPDKTANKYFYDSLGNRVRLETWKNNKYQHSADYKYDNYGKLIEVSGKGYNVLGNDEFLPSGIQMEYDDRGNLVKTTSDNKEIAEYQFDSTNMLVKSINKHGVTTNYTYDGLYKRVQVSIDGEGKNDETIEYINDVTKPFDNILMTYGENTNKYVYGLEIISIDTIDSNNKENRLYYINDELGSPIKLIDEKGKINSEYKYDEFGRPIKPNNAQNLNKQNNTLSYTGYQYDASIGLMYAQARYYMPEVGRFISEDPIKDGVNWYVYCGNNPIVFIDPLGLCSEFDDLDSNILKIGSSFDNDTININELLTKEGSKISASTFITSGIGKTYINDFRKGVTNYNKAINIINDMLLPTTNETSELVRLYNQGAKLGGQGIIVKNGKNTTKLIKISKVNKIVKIAKLSKGLGIAGTIITPFTELETSMNMYVEDLVLIEMYDPENYDIALATATVGTVTDATVFGYARSVSNIVPIVVQLIPGEDPAWTNGWIEIVNKNLNVKRVIYGE